MIGATVIPIITSAFGGTRLQASGPTAPMTAVSKYFWKVQDVESDFEQISEQEAKLITG